MINFAYNATNVMLARDILIEDDITDHFEVRLFEIKNPWSPGSNLITFYFTLCHLWITYSLMRKLECFKRPVI